MSAAFHYCRMAPSAIGSGAHPAASAAAGPEALHLTGAVSGVGLADLGALDLPCPRLRGQLPAHLSPSLAAAAA